jgi:hypothetical protein
LDDLIVHRFNRRFITALVVGVSLLLPALAYVATTGTKASAVGNCGLTQVAFCDTFDAPTPTAGTNSGDLNGVVWGVSRGSSDNNPSQGAAYGWANTALNKCGTTVVVAAPRDVQICNGQVVEAINDNLGQMDLAMYPRQPFDFAGRTGTVAFDVSDNTQGPHGAWPVFVMTDQPVPAPYNSLPALADNARNSIGVEFNSACLNGVCGLINNPNCVGVEHIFTTSSYIPADVAFHNDGCVRPSPGAGINNHVEVHLSATSIAVFMTDAGTTAPLKLVADAAFTAPLTRGLVWMEDVHYNANKFGTQQTNTFSWDNFGFDGPVLPRDLGFDIPDNIDPSGSAANGLPLNDIGWTIPQFGRSITLTVPGVTNTAGASAALLELNFWPETRETLFYSLNGGPTHSFPWAYGAASPTFEGKTIAMPVPLSEVHDGANTVRISTSDTSNGVTVANFDLILVAAGGIVPPTGVTTTTVVVPPTTAAPTTLPPTTLPLTTTTVAPCSTPPVT